MEKKRYEPIRNEAQLDRALKAGARIEFTACGCDYDAADGGWVVPLGDLKLTDDWVRGLLRRGTFRSGSDRLRAVYPARPSIFARLFRREAA